MTETTGQKLRRLRGKRPLREVSDSTGIAVSTLSCIERGTRGLSDRNKQKLADYYGRTVAYIFFDAGTRKTRE